MFASEHSDCWNAFILIWDADLKEEKEGKNEDNKFTLI